MRRFAFLIVLLACDDTTITRPPPPSHDGVHSFAHGCYTIDAAEQGPNRHAWLIADATGNAFEFAAETEPEGAVFHMRAADLGTYLLYDTEGFYVSAEDGVLVRVANLDSDLILLDDDFVSPAEWIVEPLEERFQLRHRKSDLYLGAQGTLVSMEDAASIALYPAEGCTVFPELTVDAEGEVDGTPWPDGDVYGFVETHAHLFTNFGFGGAGMFHGSPFHRLGVEHALPNCTMFHGAEGRRDLISYAFSGLGDLDTDALVPVFVTGRTPEPNHRTDGYPTFTDWPNGWNSSTHQMQYWTWIERAWRSGMRLLVNHATSNSVLCEMMSGIGAQPTRYSCNDMVAVDRQIDETYALERYIDAQSGGPGQGWFRVVTSPEEAREVINDGKLAVVLGIETSNLFDCFVAPREGFPTCDAEFMRQQLDEYYTRGVRALFPVHKFDNGFSAGDGDRNVGQIGSFINSGHWSNFVTDCPELNQQGFDRGNVVFAGLNMPRDEYQSAPPNDMSGFADNPVGTMAPFLEALGEGTLEGSYCQNAGVTPVGEAMLVEMMRLGMILEVDHLPRRSYVRAFELLVENDYPAVGTHGRTNDGLIYQIGGLSKTGFNRCAREGETGSMGSRFRNRIQFIRDNGGYPAEGFGFDLNGFAGAPRPRFGDNANCSDPQDNPITYPFSSFRGDVMFTEPQLGARSVDFNTEGMLHLGLVAELIEDVRRDGMSDEELEPLFRSAEGYLRMWERAEERAAALR